MPDIDGINEAFFQRWLVIDFNKTFRGTLEENKNLLDEITTPEELSGLLNVVMKRMPKLLEDKGVFKNAPTGEELRRVWKDHANSIESFINNQVEIEVGAVIMKNDLYKIYVLYCKDKKLSLFTEKTFSSRMKNSLIGKIEESVLKLHGKSNRVWRNIKVKNMPKGTELGETNQKIDSS
jgi:putative DNA primase/helicase